MMCKVKLLYIILFGTFCYVKGQNLKINTEFLNGNLIFKWTSVSTTRNDIIITKDSEVSGWIQVYDDQYTVEDVMQYRSVKIQVRDYKYEDITKGHVDNFETYSVNKIESTEGDSKNISWTIDTFPATRNYMIFHYTKKYSRIIYIRDGKQIVTDLKKYVYHSKPINSAKILFEVRKITMADAGYYVGAASKNLVVTEGKDAVLIVYGKPFKPVIKGGDSVKVKTRASLRCESRSTSAPSYYKTPLTYIWYINDTRNLTINTETYNFMVTKDLKFTRYSCQMKENLTSEKSKVIQLDPLYGPESVLITPRNIQNRLTIKDGEKFDAYNCSADCNPPCTLQWNYGKPPGAFVEATLSGNSSITSLHLIADKTKMTQIQCIASNSEGRKEHNTELDILYLLKPKIFLNDNKQNMSDIREGDTLQILCSVEGNPTPTIKLRRVPQGQTLGQENTQRLIHKITRAQCSDTGTYRCTGNTTKLGSKHEEFTVNVRCEPRLDTSLSVPFKTTYGSKSGPNVKVVVTVPVLANPFPSSVYSRISWQGPGGNYLNISNTVLERENVYKYWINSTIPVADQNSFGNYSLIYNEQSIVNITINAEDSPKPPSNFTWISDARGHVNLTWISNFNGGPEQFFILSHKQESGWTFVENLTDPGEGNLGYHDLGPLAPGLEYLYQLESCNRINCSLSPREVKVKVKAPSISSSSLFGDNTMLILVGASATGFLLVVVLTLAVTMYCKTAKKPATKKGNTEERLCGSTEQDDTPADVVVYAAVDKSVLMKNRQQNDVVKSDVIKDQNDDNDTMYSEVIKHPKKQQTDEKKEKKKHEEKGLQEKNEEAGASTSNDNSRSTNQDGLVYIDVEFARKPPCSDTKGRPVIHGEDEKTEYTFVDFSQKAPPVQETQENVK